MKTLIALIACVLATGALAPAAQTEDESYCLPVDIVISPKTLNLASQGNWVTVHTDIAYGLVCKKTVAIFNVENGEYVDIAWSKSDACGNFVAKFHLEEVKEIVEPGLVDLTLIGLTVDRAFCGTDTIRVIGGRTK